MRKESKEFLIELLETPSPTGFEERIQRVVRAYAKPFADKIETDLHGNVILSLNPSAKRRVMLAGHCDQIGFMVHHISPEGFLGLAPLGGIDTGVLQAARLTIHGAKGPVQGVVGRKPIHLQTDEERGRAKVDLDKLWVDIGAKNKKDAEKRVEIGDPVTFALSVLHLTDDLICGPGLDDKVGLFVAVEALRICSESKLNVGLFSVSTVQEEVGLRGARTAAYGIDPEVGIAIDVTFATDNPGGDGPKAMPCKLGAGPAISRGPNTNPVVAKMLHASADKAGIKVQPAPSSRLMGNDANAIQVSRKGVAAASVQVPNRYMHTQSEICSLKDIDVCARLLARFTQSITAKTDFRPM